MIQQAQAAREMPKYNCHKQVWALKIKAIEFASKPTIAELQALLDSTEAVAITVNPDGSISGSDGKNPEEEVVGAIITPEEEGYAAFPVSRSYVVKHNPKVGGYYVVYKDGYESFSPADAFEDGYTAA
jgi:hypothetical protein